MTKYAAYGDDAVYGLGDTPDKALEDAYEQTREPIIALRIARISNELCEWVEANGWDGKNESFEVRDGELRRTTEDEDLVDEDPEGEDEAEGQRPLTAAELRIWVDSMGWYDIEAARRLGCSRRALGQWLRGETRPPFYIRLAAAALARDLPPWKP